MPKRRAGLYKKVLSIFSGVPLSKDAGAPPRPDTSTPERRKHTTPQPPAPSHLAAPEPEPQQPAPSLPKAAPAKQPKSDTTTRTTAYESWRQVEAKFFAPKVGVSTTKQKAMVILVPVLFIVLIFVLIKVVGIGPRRTRAATKKGRAETTVAAAPEIDWQIPAPYPTTLRDPMQLSSLTSAQAKIETPKTEESEIERLIVKGILYSEDKPAAVIGTQIVHEGDKISGATVVKINSDGVVLEMNGKRWTLKVEQ